MIKFNRKNIIETLTIEQCESYITSTLENMKKPDYTIETYLDCINHYRSCIKVLRDHEASKVKPVAIHYRSVTNSFIIGKVTVYNSPSMSLNIEIKDNIVHVNVYDGNSIKTDFVSAYIDLSTSIDVFNSGKTLKTVHEERK